jgi:hypothetical protein
LVNLYKYIALQTQIKQFQFNQDMRKQAIKHSIVASNPLASSIIVKHSQQVFLLGRQNERRVDALALRADEGRGIAAISVGEPRAGVDPTISEWGNPTSRRWLPSNDGGHRAN